MNRKIANFYQDLPGFTDFGHFILPQYYQAVPDDWCVVITDVRGSTRAIEQGRYKQVNGVGVASIVAMMNASRPLQFPYVFGGDGATACLPMSMLDRLRPALVAAQQMSQQQFGLGLRIGVVPLRTIRDNGHEVLVGKFQPHPWFQQAMFLGSGLGYAESLVKDRTADNPYLINDTLCADHSVFDGFECRWNEIPSPHEENIALLIRAVCPQDEQHHCYQHVLEQIARIYGDESQYHPLRPETLSLTASPRLLSVEAGVRTAFKGRWQRLRYLFKLEYLRLLGMLLMKRRISTGHTQWGDYKKNLIANSDYRKFDEVLRMVIAGTANQRAELEQALAELHREGKIVYGIHAAPASLITCVITDYDKQHVHFLDAANGGYAMAATGMKQQLKKP